MDSEVVAQGSSEGTGTSDATSSALGVGGSTAKKLSLKRMSNQVPASRAKPKKKRAARLDYTVQEGEDMLLVISNIGDRKHDLGWRPQKKNEHDSEWRPSEKKMSRKKKPAKGKANISQTKRKNTLPAETKPTESKGVEDKALVHHPVFGTDSRWGDGLPEEVLIKIFQMVVIQDGAVPFLCRMARVCHLWNTAASSPVLWRCVTVGYCWMDPGKTQLPKTVLRINRTLNWLAQNRFSQLRDFSLCHWKNNVDYAVEVVSQFCPNLRSLKLSYCNGVTEKSFQSLSAHSRSLDSINVQHSEVQGLAIFLETHGSQIRQLLFPVGPKHDRIPAIISRSCPNLELLEISTKLDSGHCQLSIDIQGLQSGCPKLKTFRMLNVIPIPKGRSAPNSTSGFPLLEELCMATTSVSFMIDKDLRDILFGSPKLRVLDVRGCSRITPVGLAELPCVELECLFWGLYFTDVKSVAFPSPKKGLHMLTEKWSGTLKELDITNHLFTVEDIEIAMSHLAQTAQSDSLRSLSLTGTSITPNALRSVICQSTLNYLNLSSCRYFPRGLKRVYRGQEDIHQLINKLE